MSSNSPDNSKAEASNTTEQTPDENSHADLNAAVEELLNSLSNKFAGVSSEIFAKMDEMSRRLDTLETELRATKEKEGPPKQ